MTKRCASRGGRRAAAIAAATAVMLAGGVALAPIANAHYYTCSRSAKTPTSYYNEGYKRTVIQATAVITCNAVYGATKSHLDVFLDQQHYEAGGYSWDPIAYNWSERNGSNTLSAPAFCVAGAGGRFRTRLVYTVTHGNTSTNTNTSGHVWINCPGGEAVTVGVPAPVESNPGVTLEPLGTTDGLTDVHTVSSIEG